MRLGNPGLAADPGPGPGVPRLPLVDEPIERPCPAAGNNNHMTMRGRGLGWVGLTWVVVRGGLFCFVMFCFVLVRLGGV